MYLEDLGRVEKITVLQFQKLLAPGVRVYIKPNSHKTYWRGEAIYIPKDMYKWEVRDISLIKKGQKERNQHGSISLFVEEDEKYERIADREELDHINTFYEICEESTEETVNGENFGCG